MKKMNKAALIAEMAAAAKALLANNHNIIEAVEESELFSFEYDCSTASDGRSELIAVMQRIIDEPEFVEILIAEGDYEWDTEDAAGTVGNFHLYLLAEVLAFEVYHPDSRNSSGYFATSEEAMAEVEAYKEATILAATTTDSYGQVWAHAEFRKYSAFCGDDASVAIRCAGEVEESWYLHTSMNEEEQDG